MGDALVAEATRRSGVLWLVAGDRPPQLVWHVWHRGEALVVHGGREQQLHGVPDGGRVLVVVRSHDRQADRVVQWWADVHGVRPGTAQWAELTALLQAARLNAPDGDRQGERWARESTVLRLAPDGALEPVER